MSISASEIREKAEKIRGQITADRRKLHQIPEIGMDLPETSAYIRKRLDEMGSHGRTVEENFRKK